MSNLYGASRQWAERPADQRFWTISDMLEKMSDYTSECRVDPVALSECSIITSGDGYGPEYDGDDDLLLLTPSDDVISFQHYSFGQLAGIAKSPAAYLRELPAPLAAQCLNHGLARVGGEQAMLLHQNGGLALRCITSQEYSRIWNWEVAEMALALEEGEGWRVPPARPCNLPGVEVRTATAADCLRRASHPSLGIKPGDKISPAGLYASDKDCYILQINEDCSIEGGNGENLYRGVIWGNSEVGDRRFFGTMFLFESICGNHIIWNSKVLAEISIRHTGNAREAFAEAMASITGNMNRAGSEDEKRIKAAKRYELGPGRDEVVDLVFRKNFGLTRAECSDAYTIADRVQDDHGGNPTSAWGYVAGLTRLSQGVYADSRERMDRAGGKILEMAQ